MVGQMERHRRKPMRQYMVTRKILILQVIDTPFHELFHLMIVKQTAKEEFDLFIQ